MVQRDIANVKALTFDVSGTVVDWRGSLIREGMAFGAARGIDVDWASFADTWRGGYAPSMARVRRPALGLPPLSGVGEALQARPRDLPDGD